MKKLVAVAGLAALVLTELTALSIVAASPAEAVVCARGYRGAACAGYRGAVVYRRPVVRVYR